MKKKILYIVEAFGNRAHQRHAQPGEKHIRHKAAWHAERVPAEMQVRFAAENVKQPKRRADALRKHRRRRRAAHAEAERPHEQQIERDVEDAAEHQKQQRRDAVADGLHEARRSIQVLQLRSISVIWDIP